MDKIKSLNTLELRDLTLNDLPVFFQQQLDPDANRMAAFPPRTENAFMTHWKTKVLGNERAINKTIVTDGQVAGYVLCWEQDGKHLVGYWIGREYWGQGIATKGLVEFLKFLPFRPIHAYVAKHNIASIKVLEKCGFKFYHASTIFSGVHGHDIEENLMVLN